MINYFKKLIKYRNISRKYKVVHDWPLNTYFCIIRKTDGRELYKDGNFYLTKSLFYDNGSYDFIPDNVERFIIRSPHRAAIILEDYWDLPRNEFVKKYAS